MCAQIYLNGVGRGKGTHVSLFFVIMHGEYDAMLEWPFHQKVTLMIRDQKNLMSIGDAIQPDAAKTAFKRPTSKMNIATGCPLFLSLSQLDNPANKYISKDTAFIKVAVLPEENRWIGVEVRV
jgi:hypothetical protein